MKSIINNVLSNAKSIIVKSVAVVALSMVVIGAANAGWQCKVHNARGQTWYGTADSRAVASANAMKFCASGSSYVSNCAIDYCNAASVPAPRPAGGTWQCNATNARGQQWVGTGPSRAIAASNASGFCTAHSTYASNCRINACFIKY